jgi:hypothetical protein
MQQNGRQIEAVVGKVVGLYTAGAVKLRRHQIMVPLGRYADVDAVGSP